MSSSQTNSFATALEFQRKSILGALLLVSFVLRVFRFTAPGHLVQEWITDERVGTLRYSAMDPLQLFTTVPFTDTHPPLYYLLMHYWRAVFGPSLASLRLPSVIFGTATVLGVFLLGRELRNERVGLIGAILLATSPFHVSVSQYARAYALFGLSIVLSWYFLLRLRDESSRFLVVGYVISTAIMASIHVYGGFLVIGQWVYVAASVTILAGGYPVRRVVKLQLLAALLALPVLLDTALLVFAHPSAASAPHLEFPTLGVLLATLSAYMGGQYSVPIASLVLGVTGYVIIVSLSKNTRLTTVDVRNWSRSTPAAANELVVLGSWALPVIVLPIVISYAVLPIWDDVAAIGVSLALVVFTALAVDDLDTPALVRGTLTVLVGLNCWILAYYYV